MRPVGTKGPTFEGWGRPKTWPMSASHNFPRPLGLVGRLPRAADERPRPHEDLVRRLGLRAGVEVGQPRGQGVLPPRGPQGGGEGAGLLRLASERASRRPRDEAWEAPGASAPGVNCRSIGGGGSLGNFAKRGSVPSQEGRRRLTALFRRRGRLSRRSAALCSVALSPCPSAGIGGSDTLPRSLARNSGGGCGARTRPPGLMPISTGWLGS